MAKLKSVPTVEEVKKAYDGTEVAELKETKATSPQDQEQTPLDTADIQAEILTGKRPYEIELLKGGPLKMPTDFTVKEVMFKYRVDTKFDVLMNLLISEMSTFQKSYVPISALDAKTGHTMIFTSAIESSDKAQEIILTIAAKLCEVDPAIFNENISGNEIVKIGLILIAIIANNNELMQKIYPAMANGASQAKNGTTKPTNRKGSRKA